MNAWMQSAACDGEPLELFFGLDGERGSERELREKKARAICMRCPVLRECRDFTVESPQRYGFWAGLSEDERAAEHRRRTRRANAA